MLHIAYLILAEKLLEAVAALVRLHPAVPHSMPVHVRLLTELHVADVALVHLALMAFVRFLE